MLDLLETERYSARRTWLAEFEFRSPVTFRYTQDVISTQWFKGCPRQLPTLSLLINAVMLGLPFLHQQCCGPLLTPVRLRLQRLTHWIR